MDKLKSALDDRGSNHNIQTRNLRPTHRLLLLPRTHLRAQQRLEAPHYTQPPIRPPVIRRHHLLARKSDPLEGALELTWYVRPTRDQCEVLVSALWAICAPRMVHIVSDYLTVELVVGDGRIYENASLPRMIAGRPIKYVREEGGAFEGLRVSDSNQAEEEQTRTRDVREMIDGSWGHS